MRRGDWYVWTMRFPPQAVTRLEVAFIVNTNDASVLEGYNNKSWNAFIYLLESGSTWKPPIGRGSIYIQLMDGLTLDDIHGLQPAGRFVVDEEENVLIWKFDELTPSPSDNPILTYGGRLPEFNFAAEAYKHSEYYQTIEAWSPGQIDATSLSMREFGSPYDPGKSAGGFLVPLFFIVAAYGGPVLLGMAVFLLGWYLYKRWKRKKRA